MDPAKWNTIKDSFSEAAELSPQERTAYLASLARDTREQVERLLAADPDATGFIAEPFLIEQGSVTKGDGFAAPKQIDDYVLLETIGSGGMGTVYLAERTGDGFSQKAAVKLIKRGMDTDAVLKRFLTERRILANLEHPFIARMLDGGSTADGSPYFVMEYVEGEPIRDYCNRRGLDVRSRLQLFSKVCSAVTYAHQNLVVHRDLKPSNILVNDDGDPKLLDFGIAKLLGPDRDMADVTATQFRVLTPEYASPEHLRGEPPTTATDVYSLGVVLYELLTGSRPFKFTGKAATGNPDAVFSQEPPRPSTVRGSGDMEASGVTGGSLVERTGGNDLLNATRSFPLNTRELRGDLDNIVLKAIRREPERRYRSVQEMADDIDGYLKGLPVKATANSASYRISKFARRHRAAVMGGALAVVVLAAAGGFSVSQYKSAMRERTKAEKRFQDVRGLASTILFDHYERIKDLPGATEARAKLVSDALRYLDMLANESEDNAELQREIAAAYTRLSQVQGSTKSSGNLGDTESAKANAEKATAIWEKVAAVNPTNVLDRRELADSYLDLSSYLDSDRDAQRSYVEKALAMFRDLIFTHPDNVKARSDLATALWVWANTVRLDQGNAASIKVYEESVAIHEELLREGLNVKVSRRNSSLTYKNLGTLYSMEKDLPKSLELYTKALEMDQRAAAELSDNARVQLDVSFSHKGVGNVHSQLNNMPAAIDEYKKALAIQQAVFSADPKNRFAADSLRKTYRDLASLYMEAKDFASGRTLFDQAIRAAAAAGTQDKTYIALLHAKYGEFLIKTSERTKAIKELELANNLFSELKSANLLDPAFEKDHSLVQELIKQT